MLEKIVIIALSFAILGQAYVVKRLVGTWLFPACLFGVFWFVLTLLPIVIVMEAPLNPLAMSYILAVCLCFSMAALRGGWRSAYLFAQENYTVGRYSTTFMRSSLISLFSVAIFAHIANMYVQGFTLNDLAYNLADTAGLYTQRRYEDKLIANIFAQIGLIATYLVAIVGGLIFGDRDRIIKTPIIIVLSFIPSLFLVIAQSAKGAIFLSIAFFFGGMLVVVIRTGWKDLVSTKTISYAAFFSAALIFLIAVSFASRLGSGYTTDLLARYFISYSSAHLFSFADWFSWYVGDSSLGYYNNIDRANGFYTFMAIFRLFGDDRFVPIGTYDEYFDYSFFLSGNIYTIFRGLITDFGLGESLLVVALFSRLVHWQFYRMLSRRGAYFSIACTIIAVGAIYHSYLASIGMYLSIYVCLIATWVLLRLNETVSIKIPRAALAPGRREELAGEGRR